MRLQIIPIKRSISRAQGSRVRAQRFGIRKWQSAESQPSESSAISLAIENMTLRAALEKQNAIAYPRAMQSCRSYALTRSGVGIQKHGRRACPLRQVKQDTHTKSKRNQRFAGMETSGYLSRTP